MFHWPFRLLYVPCTLWEKSRIWESSLPPPLVPSCQRRTTASRSLWPVSFASLFNIFMFYFYFLCTGVLHGAVVLITELCERSSETLERFRKVWSTHKHTYPDLIILFKHVITSLCFVWVCFPDSTRFSSDHERPDHFRLFSWPWCCRSQWSFPTGQHLFYSLGYNLYIYIYHPDLFSLQFYWHSVRILLI